MRALVVDPGKVTGYGLLDWEPASPFAEGLTFEGWEAPMDAFLDWAWGWLAARPEVVRRARIDLVVCESFDMREDTVRKTAGDKVLWSAEQIGCLRTWCRWTGRPFVLQSPSEMKPFDARKAKTKALGWWREPRGSGLAGHRRDAASHALLYAVRHQLVDPRRLL